MKDHDESTKLELEKRNNRIKELENLLNQYQNRIYELENEKVVSNDKQETINVPDETISNYTNKLTSQLLEAEKGMYRYKNI